MKLYARIRSKAVLAVVTLSLALGASLAGPSGAQAGMDPFIGEIMLFAGNYCPRGYMLCNGALLPIAQYQALFSIIGTYYGGNGQTTFALPDLRSRVPVGYGQGVGLTLRNIGQTGGTENETLNPLQIPQHTHAITVTQPASTAAATKGTPAGTIPAVPERSVAAYTDAAADTALRAPTATASVNNGGQPHNNMPPFLTLQYCIAVEGLYPSRN